MTETIGQTVDARVVAIEADVAKLKAAAVTDWAKTKAWVKANWPHFLTWAGTGYLAVKAGVLALV